MWQLLSLLWGKGSFKIQCVKVVDHRWGYPYFIKKNLYAFLRVWNSQDEISQTFFFLNDPFHKEKTNKRQTWLGSLAGNELCCVVKTREKSVVLSYFPIRALLAETRLSSFPDSWPPKNHTVICFYWHRQVYIHHLVNNFTV